MIDLLFFVLGMTLHILKLTTQNQSARTYDRSTFNPHFNL